MSDYEHIKALRYKPTEEEIKKLCAEIEVWKKEKPEEAEIHCWCDSCDDWPDYLRIKFKDLFFRDFSTERRNYWDIGFSETERYLDFVLYSDYGEESDDWYRARYLTKTEQDKYREKFEQIFPGLDMNRVHLVDFCWYNCCEPEDIYEPTDDDFNKEV